MRHTTSDSKLTLRVAAKKATMREKTKVGDFFMNTVKKPKFAEPDDRMFEDADALIALAQQSFTKAAKAAVAENDRLGIPTHGSVGGRLVVRHPHKAVTIS